MINWAIPMFSILKHIMIGQNQSKIDAYEVELRLEIKSKNL